MGPSVGFAGGWLEDGDLEGGDGGYGGVNGDDSIGEQLRWSHLHTLLSENQRIFCQSKLLFPV